MDAITDGILISDVFVSGTDGYTPNTLNSSNRTESIISNNIRDQLIQGANSFYVTSDAVVGSSPETIDGINRPTPISNDELGDGAAKALTNITSGYVNVELIVIGYQNIMSYNN
jgi:hypothetical protein